jgi:transposase-like protein
MQCPDCQSTHIRKNGKRRGKQNYICVRCRRQFIDRYTEAQGYSDDIKQQCLRMYVNGMGFRGIERVTGVHHTTVISWVKQVGEALPDAYDPEVGHKSVNSMNSKPLLALKKQNLAVDSGRPL